MFTGPESLGVRTWVCTCEFVRRGEVMEKYFKCSVRSTNIIWRLE